MHVYCFYFHFREWVSNEGGFNAKGIEAVRPAVSIYVYIGHGGFQSAILHSKGKGVIKGVKIGRDTILTHLQFADDTIVFCEADLNEIV